jgi:phosphate transport system substrate-binding protein
MQLSQKADTSGWNRRDSPMSTRWLAAFLALALAACGGGSEDASAPGRAGGALQGAGATFPAPLYTRWAADYRASEGVSVNYQAIGSGGGVKQIKEGTVDFGASDKPLTLEEQQSAGLVQFPTVLGGVVPVLNVPNVEAGKLRLTGELLADVFRGVITKWNDPRLAAANPGVALPNLPITVVHRSDGSGTTFLFTTYLAGKSPAWKASPGAGDTLAWPVGIGGKGNDGVAAYVKQTPGSIGNVEYSYAKQNSMPVAVMQNRDGQFVAAEPASFAAAAAGADWNAAPGFNLLLLDEPGAQAWPITGATFILVRKTGDAGKNAQTTRFFDWAFNNGDAAAGELAYVPLPSPVKDLVRAAWAKELAPAN